MKTITLKDSAYQALAKCKEPGESFSDVIERELGQKITTVAELRAHVAERLGKGLGLRQKAKRAKAAA